MTVQGKRRLRHVILLKCTPAAYRSLLCTPRLSSLDSYVEGKRFYGSSSPKSVLFDNYLDITSKVINYILANQKVSITQADLDIIKNIPGVRYDLPLTDQTYPAFSGLVGRFGTKFRKAGIYIFTHKATGSKYVGSSNSLSRRLEQYFSSDHMFSKVSNGLLLPLIQKEGLASFTLEVFVMPAKYSSDYYFLFLEQYYLLHKSFNLNTQRIVNFRVNQGTKIYLYDREGKTFYYSSKSIRQICDDIGVAHITLEKYLDKDSFYLDFFKLTRTPLEGAAKSEFNLPELARFIVEKRKEFRKDILMKGGNQNNSSISITIKEVVSGHTFNSPSIVSTAEYLESKIHQKV